MANGLTNMGEFNLKIVLGNDAMQTGDDIATALRHVALTVERLGDLVEAEDSGRIRDLNGNTVGEWEVG